MIFTLGVFFPAGESFLIRHTAFLSVCGFSNKKQKVKEGIYINLRDKIFEIR